MVILSETQLSAKPWPDEVKKKYLFQRQFPVFINEECHIHLDGFFLSVWR